MAALVLVVTANLMDSNKLVEKFGIPQFVQHHDASDPAKQLYIELFMFSQFM
jgi:hypothetical protein